MLHRERERDRITGRRDCTQRIDRANIYSVTRRQPRATVGRHKVAAHVTSSPAARTPPPTQAVQLAWGGVLGCVCREGGGLRGAHLPARVSLCQTLGGAKRDRQIVNVHSEISLDLMGYTASAGEKVTPHPSPLDFLPWNFIKLINYDEF